MGRKVLWDGNFCGRVDLVRGRLRRHGLGKENVDSFSPETTPPRVAMALMFRTVPRRCFAVARVRTFPMWQQWSLRGREKRSFVPVVAVLTGIMGQDSPIRHVRWLAVLTTSCHTEMSGALRRGDEVPGTVSSSYPP